MEEEDLSLSNTADDQSDKEASLSDLIKDLEFLSINKSSVDLIKDSENDDDDDASTNECLADREFKKNKPSSVFDDQIEQTYHINDHIGYSPSPLIPVYTCTTTTDDDELWYSVKLVNWTDDRFTETFLKLSQETDINSLIPYHDNIIGIQNEFDCNDLFCVVFQRMELGSLRSITNSFFPDGLPEECVVVAVQEALRGLSFIHERGQVHKQINAGSIYMNSKGEIKIGFSATVYDDNKSLNQASSSSVLEPISICNWGAAPEVYYKKMGGSLYSAKSDIWSIGMTALELAFGSRFSILNRISLAIILRKMNAKNRLFQEEQGKRHYVKEAKGLVTETRVFSREFQDMVIECLAVDAETRPTAVELLERSIFRESTKDVNNFHELVMENLYKKIW